MKFEQNLIQGKFLKRLNRFSVLVEVNGKEEKAHLANSGRLRELLVPGYKTMLMPVESASRKTKYDLCLVQTRSRVWVSSDARLPNILFHEAFLSRQLKPFLDFHEIQPEVVWGKSRLDFCLSSSNQLCFAEIKSITLVEDRMGYFPDAPTERGRKHLCELLKIKKEGDRGAVVFIVQREDAGAVQPNDQADPAFGRTLRNVFQQGVEVYAYKCQVNKQGVFIQQEIPVYLDEATF